MVWWSASHETEIGSFLIANDTQFLNWTDQAQHGILQLRQGVARPVVARTANWSSAVYTVAFGFIVPRAPTISSEGG